MHVFMQHEHRGQGLEAAKFLRQLRIEGLGKEFTNFIEFSESTMWAVRKKFQYFISISVGAVESVGPMRDWE